MVDPATIEQMFALDGLQGSLFGNDDIGFDRSFSELERIQLDPTSWLDYQPMWLSGDERLYDTITARSEWSQPVVRMYDHDVLTPRLVAHVPHHLDPVLPLLIGALSERYGVLLDQVSAGWYRDGNDSVALHGDRIARDRPRSIVATVSLGEPRRFLIRPKSGGDARSFSLGHGDLVVMGGSSQRDWEHGVPKVARAGPRVALMFRHLYD